MSDNDPSNAALHISHSLHGSPSWGFKQFMALAKTFALVENPVLDFIPFALRFNFPKRIGQYIIFL